MNTIGPSTGRSSEWNHSMAGGRFYLLRSGTAIIRSPNGKRNGRHGRGRGSLIVNLIVAAMLHNQKI
jgi:hypothetical protein